jgi:hypothetical protein
MAQHHRDSSRHEIHAPAHTAAGPHARRTARGACACPARQGREEGAAVSGSQPRGPHPQTQSRYVRKLQQIAKLSEDEKFEDIIRVSLEVAEDAKAKPADKAVGYQNAAYGALQLDDFTRGLQYLEAAIATDALGNDNHFQMMWQVVQIRFSEEQYEEA